MVSVFRTETWSCGIVNLVGDETYSCVQSASVVVVTMLGTNQDLTDWQCVHLCWMISDVVEAVSRRNSWCQASSLGGCVCSEQLPPSFLTVLIDDLRVLLPLQVWLHIHILLIATFRHVVSEDLQFDSRWLLVFRFFDFKSQPKHCPLSPPLQSGFFTPSHGEWFITTCYKWEDL